MPKPRPPARPTPPLFALLVDQPPEVLTEMMPKDCAWQQWLLVRGAATSLNKLEMGRDRFLVWSRRYTVVNERATRMTAAFGPVVQVCGPAVFVNLTVREMLDCMRHGGTEFTR